MVEEQIKHMVDRFLRWRLPENFTPDAGISFKATFNDHLPQPAKHNPTGTNLFDATQADAMVRYMVDGLEDVARPERENRKIIQLAAIPQSDDTLPTLFALCNDGSVWFINKDHFWLRVEPVPQGD